MITTGNGRGAYLRLIVTSAYLSILGLALSAPYKNATAAILDAGNGTITIGPSDDTSSYSGFRTADSGTIDASAVVGGFELLSGQRIDGSGTMIGNFAIDSGATVEVGTDNDIVDLDFTGALTFPGGSALKITINANGTGSADVLEVSGFLNINSLVALDFDILNGPLDDQAYVFARYGALFGSFGSNAPVGYQIDYMYDGLNQVALVRDVPVPVPAPTPIALIGLGALALRGLRRRAKV